MSGHIGKNQRVNRHKDLSETDGAKIANLTISEETLKWVIENQQTTKKNKYPKEKESGSSPEKGL